MKTPVIFLIPFFIVFAISVHGQASWERITPRPQEHTINDIIKIPGIDKLIAVGEGSTVMISNNDGADWDIYLNPAGKDNGYNCKGVCFINENTGFINGGYETILKTSNGGISWNLVYSGNSMYNWQCINEIEFTNETTGFAIADNGQLFKSSDAGDSWELIESGVSFDLNVLEFADSENGFVFSDGDGYLKTTDGGESWSLENLPAFISGLNFKDVYFTSSSTGIAIGSKYIQESTQGFIYKTDDGGVTWTEKFHDENGWYWPEAIDFANEDQGMVSCNTIMYGCINYVTFDGGDTWEETPMFYFSIAPCRTLYYKEDKAIIAGNMGMIAYSENDGETWEFHSERTFFGEIFDAQFVNGEIGYASAIEGSGGGAMFFLYKTIDGGENWFPTASTDSQPTFYFVNEDIGFIAVEEMSLTFYKTINGGQDWTFIELEDFEFEPLCIRFYDELNGLICGESTLLKTSDGGDTWIEINTGSSSFTDIEYKNENEVFICGNSFVMKSIDGGNIWEKYTFSSNIHATDIYFRDMNTAFLLGSDTILISEDGGETWAGTSINNQYNIYYRSVNFPTQNIGFAVGHGQYETIVKTIDGGETWNTINSNSTSGLSAAYFSDENNGLVFGENGIVLKTTTGGVTGFEKTRTLSHNSWFEVYPNPFTDKISISIKVEVHGRIVVFIYDLKGELVLNKTFMNTQKKMGMDLSALENGVYFCNIKYEGHNISKKIIKTK